MRRTSSLVYICPFLPSLTLKCFNRTMAANKQIAGDLSRPQHPVIDTPRSHFIHMPNMDTILTWCAVCLGAYLGALIRVGISYFKIWKIETQLTVMYAQILGCLIMGFVTHHKHWMFSASRWHKTCYTGLTTGLCGSITTFSTWNLECSKIFMLQWDQSWGNALGSYNGGRTIEWLVCLWTGVALPLAALHVGQHLALWSSYSNTRFDAMEDARDSASGAGTMDHTPPPKHGCLETLLVIFYILATIIVLALPIHFNWTHLTYTVFFGALGAWTRYELSTLNVRYVCNECM